MRQNLLVDCSWAWMTNKPKRRQSVLINSSMVRAIYQHQLFRAWIWTSVWHGQFHLISTPPCEWNFLRGCLKWISGVYDCQLPLISAIFLSGKVKNFKYRRGICVGTLFVDLKFSRHLPLRNYPKASAVQKNHNKYVPFLFFSLFRIIFTATIIFKIVTKFHAEKSY